MNQDRIITDADHIASRYNKPPVNISLHGLNFSYLAYFGLPPPCDDDDEDTCSCEDCKEEDKFDMTAEEFDEYFIDE